MALGCSGDQLSRSLVLSNRFSSRLTCRTPGRGPVWTRAGLDAGRPGRGLTWSGRGGQAERRGALRNFLLLLGTSGLTFRTGLIPRLVSSGRRVVSRWKREDAGFYRWCRRRRGRLPAVPGAAQVSVASLECGQAWPARPERARSPVKPAAGQGNRDGWLRQDTGAGRELRLARRRESTAAARCGGGQSRDDSGRLEGAQYQAGLPAPRYHGGQPRRPAAASRAPPHPPAR